MVIMLVAVFILFVVGAMAALSIDAVTLYTARSEAQLAADAAALAGARVLANSGLTSAAAGPMGAEDHARRIATQVAAGNKVGGKYLNSAGTCTVGAEISVCFNDGDASFGTNPHVTVTVQRTDLPTFFARLWGRTQVTVGASATAEAYNPSGANALGVATPSPVAPICAKPWLLPNKDPSAGGAPIFDPTTGAITTTTLLGQTYPGIVRLRPRCINCTPPPPLPVTWRYYPGDPTSFPAPTKALPSCVPALTTGYEESIAGCIQTPIKCNSPANIDTSNYATRRMETAHAVNCLTHTEANKGDQVDTAAAPSPPFQFLAGDDNPIPGLAGSDVTVSDSLVTVPVFDSNDTTSPISPVTVIGFVQLFLSPDGNATPTVGGNLGYVKTTVINMVGCGSGATGTQILGNGASPVAVRLISP